MVNNSINIIKTKESLSSDGQQFHQYQQNEHLSGCPFKPKKLSVPFLYPGVPAGLHCHWRSNYPINRVNTATYLCLSQIRTLDFQSYLVVFIYVQWFQMKGVHFVDIGGIVDHHCLNFLLFWYRNGTESFFGLKGRPSVVRDVKIHNQPVLRMRRK
jgi:hypothetical protein